jgi:hypothetical protein
MESIIDAREQLYNDRLVGDITSVSWPAERVTRLRGILFDLDPAVLLPGNPYMPPADEPIGFYENVRPVLERHPLARHAEVRSSGRGLHVIVWMDPPAELNTAAEQRYWSAAVAAVQRSLPSDPRAPGITALTRPVGSVNRKNGATVTVLKPGEPVAPERVLEFTAELARAPFRVLAGILLGGERLSPCPFCRQAGSEFTTLDRVGRCYPRCGTVGGDRLFDLVLRPDVAVELETTADRSPARGPE